METSNDVSVKKASIKRALLIYGNCFQTMGGFLLIMRQRTITEETFLENTRFQGLINAMVRGSSRNEQFPNNTLVRNDLRNGNTPRNNEQLQQQMVNGSIQPQRISYERVSYVCINSRREVFGDLDFYAVYHEN